MSEFRKNDKVSWTSSSGKIHGAVMKKLTQDTNIKSHTVRATPEEPQYEVKSNSTGKTAAHKPDSLTKE